MGEANFVMDRCDTSPLPQKDFLLGGLHMRVTGYGPIARAFCTEFGDFSADGGNGPDLIVNIGAGERKREAEGGDYVAGANTFRPTAVTQRLRWCHLDTIFGDRHIEVRIEPRRISPAKKIRNAFRGLNSGVPSAMALLNNDLLSYRHFWPVLHLAMLNKGMACLHASAVERDGKALLIPSIGGGGKTSTAAVLVSHYGYRFLSEDLAVVDGDGGTYLSPRRVAFYGSDYDFAAKSVRRNFWQSQTTGSKLSWVLDRARGKNPLRRTAAVTLFREDGIAREARISCVGFLSRSSRGDIASVPLTIDRLVDRCFHATFREFRELYELYHLKNATIPSYPYLDVADIASQTCGVYRQAFADAKLFHIDVPMATHPRDVASLVHESMANA